MRLRRIILPAAVAIPCLGVAMGGAMAGASEKPLRDHYLLLQREYFSGPTTIPYGITTCAVPYARLTGGSNPAATPMFSASAFESAQGGAQTASAGSHFAAGGDWVSATQAAIAASKPYQSGNLNIGGCPADAAVRTFLVAVQQPDLPGTVVLAVRCETASGVVTGATTAASTYLAQLMRGGVPACAAIDGADFSTMTVEP